MKWQRVLGGLLGIVAGVLLTIVPAIWDSYDQEHRLNAQAIHEWTLRFAPAAVLPSLVGLCVGQSLPERLRRKNAKSRPGS